MSLKQRILNLLQDGQWHSTLEIENMGTTNSSTTRALRHLRADGHVIEKRRMAKERQSGLFSNYQEHEYRLVGESTTVVAEAQAEAVVNG